VAKASADIMRLFSGLVGRLRDGPECANLPSTVDPVEAMLWRVHGTGTAFIRIIGDAPTMRRRLTSASGGSLSRSKMRWCSAMRSTNSLISIVP